MEFWLIILAVVAFFAILPFVRLVFKRISMVIKLKKACKKCGAKLIPTRKLWFFGGRKCKSCDFHVETEKEIISVKLFQMLRRSSSLHFTKNEEYYCEHCVIMLFGRYGGSHSITVKTKPRLIPDYDFSYKLPQTDKPKRKLLLINPVCTSFFIHSKEKHHEQGRADIGDRLGDIELYALKPLIRYLCEFS